MRIFTNNVKSFKYSWYTKRPLTFTTKLLLVLLISMGALKTNAQLTVFTDDFSANQNTTYTTSGAIGAGVWSVLTGGTAGQDFGARRNTTPAQLELTNDATAATNQNGWTLTSTPTSSFSAPYNTTLNLNPGKVSWTLNMRQIRTDPAGLASGSYGVAYVLAGTSTTTSTVGTGYAVALGQSGTTDPVRLIKYSAGLATSTNIITSNTSGLTDFGAEYLSIQVTYIPSTNTWELLLRNDGATAFADPTSGTLTTQGTAIDATYAGTPLTLMGAYWSGSTGATQTAFFDNVKVTVVSGCTTPSTQASGLTLSSATTSQFSASWTAGTGDGTMIVVRPTAQTLSAPVSGTSYTANTDYSLASQINTNNRVVFRAAGTTVTTTNLSPGTQYTATAYEYNTTGDCYNTTSAPSTSIYTLSLEPTAHAASFSAAAATPTSINLSFSAANTLTNASGYIILQRLGSSAPTGTPTDATGYTVGNTIGDGTVAAIITSAVAVSSTISGLATSTQYSYTLIPFNWDGTNAATYNYYTAATIPSATATTLSLNAPTVVSPTATAITNTTATLGGNVSSDGGDAITGRGVVWAETSLNNNPQISGANVTQVTSAGTTGVFTVSATGLPVATQISYAVYAINGQGTSYTSPATFYTLENPTTVAASAILFGTVTTNSIQLSWTNGDGANRIVVARPTATSRVSPSNGTGYTVNSSDFSDVLNPSTGTGNIVIYNGTGSAVSVTGLSAGTSYSFDIYEYNGATVTANYGANFTGTRSTMAAEPTVQASAVNFTNVTSTAFKVNWTVGNGANSLVLVKDVTAVDSDPVDATTYTANTVFGSGTQLGTGNFVVYKSTAATVTVTGLTDGHTYYVAVYSFNGSGGTENYLTTAPATGSQLATTVNYYSQGSLDPAVLTNWNSNRAGGGSSPAAFTDGNFVIQNTHNMTTTGVWSVGTTGTKLQIENGGTLTAGHAITVAAASTFQIDNGGKYSQTAPVTMGSTIFAGTEVFAPNSTVEISANPSGTSLPSSPGYGNLTINVTTGSTALGWSANITTIQGNLTILGTGAGATRHALTASGALTLNIGGDFIVTGGNFWLSSGAGTCTVNLTGNLLVNGGTLDLANSSGAGTINVGGNVTVSSGTLTEGGSTTTSKIVFNKTGSQSITGGGTISNLVNMEIATGSLTSLASNVTIPGNLSLNTGIISLGSNTLTINGAVSGAGTITSTSSSGLTIGGTAGTLNFTAGSALNNLTLNNASSATLGTALDVYGTIALTTASLNLNAQNLTLKSNASGTARIANLTGSTLTGATNVTVERYIKLRAGGDGRAYRLLTPTVNTTGNIQANWMEGGMNTAIGTNVDPVPGFGTQISGAGGNANGFDKTLSNASSLYLTNNGTTPTYTAVGSVSTGTMNAKTGYFLYLRGDRNQDMTLPLASNMPTSATTLRTTGTVLTGTQTTFTNAFTGGGAWNLVTNPYPSPIDWSLVQPACTGVTGSYIYWDPNIGSRGGFAAVTTAGVSTPATSATQIIQPGQAFFVESDGNVPTVSIQESHKVAGNNNDVFLTAPTPVESFRTELYFTERNGYRRIADGVIALYDNNYSTAVDAKDTKEINNWDENIAISRDGKRLAIEGRPVIGKGDDLPIFMNNMKKQGYEFEFTPTAFSNTNLKAELVDNFLGTRTLLSVTGTTVVRFNITDDPASAATDRFKVVFGAFGNPQGVDAITLKASAQQNAVAVEWTSKTETDMASYEVERQSVGTAFTKVYSSAATGNSAGAVSYNWLDATAAKGVHVYRVKGIDKAGNIRYSDAVRVRLGNGEPGIVLYPNPVQGRSFTIDLNNLPAGLYLLSLYNNQGQLIYSRQLQHDGSQATRTITPDTDLGKGAYQLQLSGSNGFKTTQSIIKN